MIALRGFLCLFFCLSGLASATQPETPPAPKKEYLPGVALSQGITEITGVAISPLLGVSSVGAWRYWKTPEAGRAELPWYAQPWAWGTGFALLALCFLKDSLGTAVPGLLKKPLDMLELFENKASALMASGAFVPLVAAEMARHMQAERGGIPVPHAMIGGSGFTMIDPAWLMVPVSIIAFLLVWVCCHAINVLIILSPFSTLDALLKLARTALLALVGLLYAITPALAAVLCIVIIALAAWMAPAAMRLMIFGARYAADILLPWRARGSATPEQPHAFTLGRAAGLPPRTGGRMVMSADGTAVFRYRRWCVLNERVIPLPEGKRYVEKGLFAPTLVHQSGDGNDGRILLFLPRYRGHEESIARKLNFHGVREHPLKRGFAAVKAWLASLFKNEAPDSPMKGT